MCTSWNVMTCLCFYATCLGLSSIDPQGPAVKELPDSSLPISMLYQRTESQQTQPLGEKHEDARQANPARTLMQHPNECPYYKMTIQFVPVPYQCHHRPFISCSINSYRLWWLVLIINTSSPRKRTSQHFCERLSKLVKTQVGKQPKSSNTNTMPRAMFSTWVKRKKQEFKSWKTPASNSPCFPTVDRIRPPTSHCCSRDSSSMMGCPSDHESKKSLLL